MAEPFRIRRAADGAVFEYDTPVDIPAGFERFTGAAASQGPATHPWVQVNQAARQGKMPTGETIGEAATRGAKVAAGLETPSSFQEMAASLAIPGALTAAGGIGAPALAARLGAPALVTRLAPAAGRVATAGAVKAAQQDIKGEEVLGPASLAAAEALLGEGLLKAAGTALRPLAKPANVLSDIRRRLSAGPDGPADVQVLDAWVRRIAAADEGARPMEVQRAVSYFKTIFGDDIANVFRGSVAEAKLGVKGVGVPIPTGVSEAARGAQRAARSNTGRAGVDTLMSQTPLGIVSGKLVTDRLMK